MKFVIPLLKIARDQFGINPAIWGPRMRDFFYAVEQGKITNRETAALELYNSSPQKSAFKSLESSTRTALIDGILVYKNCNTNEIVNKAILIRKAHAVINILKLLSLSKIAGLMSEWAIKLAIKYHQTEVVLDLADTLECYYLNNTPNKKLASYYRKISNDYMSYYHAERLVKKKYARLYFPHISKKAINSDSINELLKAIENLKPYSLHCPTLTFKKHFFVFSIWKYFHLKQYENVVEKCEEHEAYLKSLNFASKNSHLIVKNAKIYAYLALRQFDDAQQTLKSSSEFITVNGFNWCRNRLHGISIYLNLGDISYAEKCYKEGLKETKIELYTNEIKYLYQLNFIYIQLFKGQKLEISEFNKLKGFYRDKDGMNIPYRIAKLWNAAISDYTSISDLKESTEKFLRRSLSKHHLRSRTMFELILLIPKSFTQKEKFVRTAENLFGKLCSIDPKKTEEPLEIEIVTYELLWKQILLTTRPKGYLELINQIEIGQFDHAKKLVLN